MDAVGPVDVGSPGRPKHGCVPRGGPGEAVRRWIGWRVGLRFYDHAASSIHEQDNADEIAGDLHRIAQEERAAQLVGINQQHLRRVHVFWGQPT